MADTTVEGILVKISADISSMHMGVVQMQRDMESVAKVQEQWANRQKKTKEGTKQLVDQYYEAGAALFVYNQAIGAIKPVFSSFIQIYQNMTQAGIHFQKMLADSNTIVTRQAGAIEVLRGEMIRLLRTTSIQPSDLGFAAYEILSAGIKDVAEVTRILDASTKLSIAGIADLKSTVDAMTSTLNAYRYTAAEAEYISKVFFYAVEEGKTTMQQFAGSISVILPVAAELGLSIKEVSIQAAALTQVGFSVSEAFTYMRQLLLSTIEPNEHMAIAIAKLGFASGAAAVQALGFQGFLEAIRDQSDGSAASLANLTTRIQSNQALMALTGPLRQAIARMMAVEIEKSEALNAAYKIQEETLQRLIQRYENLQYVARARLADAGALDWLKSMYEYGLKVVDSSYEIIENNEKWATGLSGIVVSMGLISKLLGEIVEQGFKIGLLFATWNSITGGVAAIFGGIGKIFGKLRGSLFGLVLLIAQGAFKLFDWAKAIANWTGWLRIAYSVVYGVFWLFTRGIPVLAILSAATAVIYYYWDEIKEKVGDAWHSFKLMVGLTSEAKEAQNQYNEAWDQTIRTAEAAGDKVTALIAKIQTGKEKLGREVLEEFIKDAGDPETGALKFQNFLEEIRIRAEEVSKIQRLLDEAEGPVRQTDITEAAITSLGYPVDPGQVPTIMAEAADESERLNEAYLTGVVLLENQIATIRNMIVRVEWLEKIQNLVKERYKEQLSILDTLVDTQKIYGERADFNLQAAQARNASARELLGLIGAQVRAAETEDYYSRQKLQLEKEILENQLEAQKLVLFNDAFLKADASLQQEILGKLKGRSLAQAEILELSNGQVVQNYLNMKALSASNQERERAHYLLQGQILELEKLNIKEKEGVTNAEQKALAYQKAARELGKTEADRQRKILADIIAAEKERVGWAEVLQSRYEFQLEVLEAFDRPLAEQLAIKAQELKIARDLDALAARQYDLDRRTALNQAEGFALQLVKERGDALNDEGQVRDDLLRLIAETNYEEFKARQEGILRSELLSDQSGQYENIYGQLQQIAIGLRLIELKQEQAPTNVEKTTLEYIKMRRELGYIVNLNDVFIDSLTTSLEELSQGKTTVKKIGKNFMEPVKAEFLKGFATILKNKKIFDARWELNMSDTIAGSATEAAQASESSFASFFTNIGSSVSGAFKSFMEFFGFIKNEGATAVRVGEDVKNAFSYGGPVTAAGVYMQQQSPGTRFAGGNHPLLTPPQKPTFGGSLGNVFGAAGLGATVGSIGGGFFGESDYGAIAGGLIAGGYAVGAAITSYLAASATAVVGQAIAAGSLLGPIGAAIGAIIAGLIIVFSESSKKSAKQLAEKAYEKFFENVTGLKIVKKTGDQIALTKTFQSLDDETRVLTEVFALLSTAVNETAISTRRAYAIALQQLSSGISRANELEKDQAFAGIAAALETSSLEDVIDMFLNQMQKLVEGLDRAGSVGRFTGEKGDAAKVSSGLEGLNRLIQRGLVPSIEEGIEAIILFFGEDIPRAIKPSIEMIIRQAYASSLFNLKKYFNFAPEDVANPAGQGLTLEDALALIEARRTWERYGGDTGFAGGQSPINKLIQLFLKADQGRNKGVLYTDEAGFTRRLLTTIPDLLILLKNFAQIQYELDDKGRIVDITAAGGLDLDQMKDLLKGQTAEYADFMKEVLRGSVVDIIRSAASAYGGLSDVFDTRIDELMQEYLSGALTITQVLQRINEEFDLDLTEEDLNVTGEDIVRRLQIEQEAFAAVAEGLGNATQAWLEGASMKEAMDTFAQSLSDSMRGRAQEALSAAFFKGTDFENLLSVPFQNLETAIENLFSAQKAADEAGEDFDFNAGLNDAMDLLASDFEGVMANIERMQPILEAFAEMQERIILAMTTFAQAAQQASDFQDAIDLMIAGFGDDYALVESQQYARIAAERRDEAISRVQDAYTIKPPKDIDLFNLALGTANIGSASDENLKRIISRLGQAADAIAEAAYAEIAVLEEQLRIAQEWQDLVWEAEDALRQVSGYGGDDQQRALALLEQEKARAERLIETYRTGTDAERLAAARELVQLGPALLNIAEAAGYDPGSSVFEDIRASIEGVLQEIIQEGQGKAESIEDIQADIRDAQNEAVAQLEAIRALLEIAEQEAINRKLIADDSEDWLEYIAGGTGSLKPLKEVNEKIFARLDKGINVFKMGEGGGQTDPYPNLNQGGLVFSRQLTANLHGPEAVIPLDRFPDLVGELMPTSSSSDAKLFGELRAVFFGFLDLGFSQVKALTEVTGYLSGFMDFQREQYAGMADFLSRAKENFKGGSDNSIAIIRPDEPRNDGHRRRSPLEGDEEREQIERRIIVELKNEVNAILTKDPADPEDRQLMRALVSAFPKAIKHPQVRRALENAIKGIAG